MKGMLQNHDRLVGTILLVGCAILFVETFSFKTRPYVPLNTAFWPRVILGALALVGAILAFKGRIGSETHERIDPNALLVTGGALLFVFSLKWLGFFAAAAVVAACGYVWLSDPRGPRTLVTGVVFGVVSAAVVHLVFRSGLKVQLPEGVLF
jgi:hypothetical protein